MSKFPLFLSEKTFDERNQRPDILGKGRGGWKKKLDEDVKNDGRKERGELIS